MRIAMFSTKPYDRRSFEAANLAGHDLLFLEPRLTTETAVLAHGAAAVCPFVNDDLSAPVLEALAARMLAPARGQRLDVFGAAHLPARPGRRLLQPPEMRELPGRAAQALPHPRDDPPPRSRVQLRERQGHADGQQHGGGRHRP